MRLFQSTPGGKVGAIDGLNLFFGALLGANLGTLGAMPLGDYVRLVVLLAGTVMVLRMLSTSERRGYMLGLTAVYAGIIVAILTIPKLQPKGMSPNDLHRLVATLAVWMIFVVGSELTPVREVKPPEPPSAP
jgi:hypothetical protein